jgi:predicted nucleic acid-binding protein
MSTSTDLPDLNVWLALTWPEHLHQQHAVRYWEQQAAEHVLFCTVTALLEALCQQPGVKLAKPEHDGWEVFHQLLRGAELPARLCTDAHLAALAIANGWRLQRLQLP